MGLPNEVQDQPNEHIVQTILVNALLSIGAGFTAKYLMKQYIPIFIQRKLYGLDQCKVCFL